MLTAFIAVANTGVLATGLSNVATEPGSPLTVIIPALASIIVAMFVYLGSRERKSRRPDTELTAQARLDTVEKNMADAKADGLQARADLRDDLDRLSRRVDRIEEHMWDRPTT